MTENPSDRKKIQRSISATDAEWNLITRRAGSSHHSSRSEFLIDRALATSDESATPREPSSAVFRQMAVDIRTLVLFSEVQFRRMSPSSPSSEWQELVAQAESEIAREENEAS